MENIDWSNVFEESSMICSSNGVPQNINKIGSSSSSSPPPPSQQIQRTELWNSRSGGGISWEVAINAEMSPSFIEYSRPSTLNPDNNIHLPPILNAPDQKKKKPVITISSTPSFDSSLDCLLSASTSLTDTTTTSADQDDGISLICNNLWNFAPNTVSEEITINHPNGNKRKRENLDFQSTPTPHQGSTSFQLISEQHKKGRFDKHPVSSSNINFQQSSSSAEPDSEAIAQMKEIIYRAAAFRPVNFGEEAVEKPKRKNVKISKDPQTVAARQRRERISERIRVLQKLVPGGSKMDTASMLDEAANYLKFLRSQVKALEALGQTSIDPMVNIFPPHTNLAFSPFLNYSLAMQQPQFLIHNPSNPVNQFKS